MDRAALAVGVVEVVGATALVISTFTIPAFVDMALAWRMLAVFMLLEGGNRLLSNLSL